MVGESIQVFFSYAHRDEGLRDELASHLAGLKRQGVISAWHDRQIGAGTEWANQIDENLGTADIILLLVSSAFINSNYCWGIELKRAMQRHEAKEACVIPIILRPVDWQNAPFSKLQALPKNAKPITTWDNLDEAFYDVAQGIRAIVERLIEERNENQQQNRNQAQVKDGQMRLKRLEQNISDIERQMIGDLSPDYKKVLDWLTNRKLLAQKVGQQIIARKSELSELEMSMIEQFYWEIEKYLELLYYSFYSESRTLLTEPPFSPSLPISAYSSAFTLIKDRIPEEISREVATEVRERFDYLIRRLS
ncbi:TIR domain-containing protein [Phormidesmis sp. 146-33]